MNPILLRMWLHGCGAVGVWMDGVCIRPSERLGRQRDRIWMACIGRCTLVCLLMVTTTSRTCLSVPQVPGETSAHEAASLPVTKKLGPRDYTLTQLVTGVSWLHPTRAPRGNEVWSSLAGFQ